MTKDEALRLALSTLNEVRSETFRLMRNGQTLYAEKKVWDTIFAIKQALEQPEPEPVANYCRECLTYNGHHEGCSHYVPDQEPVAWQWLDTGNFRKNLSSTAERSAWRPLYTSPPKRELLTDEQVAYILGQLPTPPTNDGSALHDWAMQAVRELAAHGIKGDAP